MMMVMTWTCWKYVRRAKHLLRKNFFWDESPRQFHATRLKCAVGRGRLRHRTEKTTQLILPSRIQKAMTYTENDIEKLLRYGEHITLECKLAEGGLPKSLWET